MRIIETKTFCVLCIIFTTRKALPADIHRKIMKLYRTYLAVGGMPQAVASYITGDTFDAIDFTKSAILALYEEDFNKYGTNAGLATRIFKSIPKQLAHHNSHFKLSAIKKRNSISHGYFGFRILKRIHDNAGKSQYYCT